MLGEFSHAQQDSKLAYVLPSTCSIYFGSVQPACTVVVVKI